MSHGVAYQKTQTRKDGFEVYRKPTFAGKKLIYICSPFRPQSLDPREADLEKFEKQQGAGRLSRTGSLNQSGNLRAGSGQGFRQKRAMSILRTTEKMTLRVWKIAQKVKRNGVTEIQEKDRRVTEITRAVEQTDLPRAP